MAASEAAWQFHRDIVSGAEVLKWEVSYDAHRFTQMVAEVGGVEGEGAVTYLLSERWDGLPSDMSSLTAKCPWSRRFGRPLFGDYDLPIELDLLEQRSFESGVTMHRFAIPDVSEVRTC